MDFRRMNQYITKSEGLVEIDFRRMNKYIIKWEGFGEMVSHIFAVFLHLLFPSLL